MSWFCELVFLYVRIAGTLDFRSGKQAFNGVLSRSMFVFCIYIINMLENSSSYLQKWRIRFNGSAARPRIIYFARISDFRKFGNVCGENATPVSLDSKNEQNFLTFCNLSFSKYISFIRGHFDKSVGWFWDCPKSVGLFRTTQTWISLIRNQTLFQNTNSTVPIFKKFLFTQCYELNNFECFLNNYGINIMRYQYFTTYNLSNKTLFYMSTNCSEARIFRYVGCYYRFFILISLYTIELLFQPAQCW